MDDGFDFCQFGGAEAERDCEKAEFNERWNRLMEIHGDLLDDFVLPVLDSGGLSSAESAELKKCLLKMKYWFDAINADLENANQNHLSHYAVSVGNIGLKAIQLCGRYDVYDNIQSVEYVSRRQMVVLNGADLWYLG